MADINVLIKHSWECKICGQIRRRSEGEMLVIEADSDNGDRPKSIFVCQVCLARINAIQGKPDGEV